MLEIIDNYLRSLPTLSVPTVIDRSSRILTDKIYIRNKDLGNANLILTSLATCIEIRAVLNTFFLCEQSHPCWLESPRYRPIFSPKNDVFG